MADITLSTVVRHGDDVLFRNLDGEAVIVDLKTGTYYGLDPVGTCIWVAVEKAGPLSRALDAVLDSFEVTPEVATPDILKLAREFLEKGLLVTAPAPAG